MARRIVVAALLVVGLAASSFVLGQRARVESRNRAVELVIDYSEVEQMAAATGRDTLGVLRAFKRAGATSVAVTEKTVRDALQDRSIMPLGGRRYVLMPEVARDVETHLRRVLPLARGSLQFTYPEGAAYAWLEIPEQMPAAYLETLPLGLPREAVRTAREAGLDVVARLVNYPGATHAAIDAIAANARSRGARKVIFSGDQVLGFKGAVDGTAGALRKHGLYFGLVEFAKQRGETELSQEIPAQVIPVHSIGQNEMPALSETAIEERFQRAVRERGVRLCYVRMYATDSDELVEANAAYVRGVASAIRSAGCALKSSHPLDELHVPAYVRVAVGVGAAAGLVLLVFTLVELSTAATIVWVTAAALACGGLAAWADPGRKAVALLAAVVFPMLAVLKATGGFPEVPTPTIRPLLQVVRRLIVAVLTTGAGGLLVVGLLSSRETMLRIDQFAGVKAAHLLPILVLAALFAGAAAWRPDTWTAQTRLFRERLGEIGRNPVLWWQAAGTIVLLGALAMLVMRSGNEYADVSGLELRFRALLDRVFFVRPRTKEFLVGYPALLLAIAFAARGRRRWAAPLAVVGAIGLVSAVNTFCHLHTPVVVSAIRLANGAILGTLTGAVIYRIVRRLPGLET